MAMNRGEWSELYSILFLLLNQNLEVVDENLDLLTNDLYSVESISDLTTSPVKYTIDNDKFSIENYDGSKFDLSLAEIEHLVDDFFAKIKAAPRSGGAFDIDFQNEVFNEFVLSNVVKSPSSLKGDVIANIMDQRLAKTKVLTYSIKSSLGSPATLLNASNQTNFIYKITGLDTKMMDKINKINTRTKLVDRLNLIYDSGGEISFVKVESDTFNYNLKMIDTNLPNYLANVLLASYGKNNKNLKQLFLESNKFEDETFALKKLSDFLHGVSFGFFPGKKWDGTNEVSGGLFVVSDDGKVVTLDLIYFKDSVSKFLINETKLDSPSSTRYKMLDLYVKDNEIYFKLNLQIRYKN